MLRSAVISVCFLVFGLLAAEEDGWNLTPAARVAEAEAAAGRGDRSAAERALQQLLAEAKSTGTLSERSAAEARVDRLRLALARAHTKAGAWPEALPLLGAISAEGKSPAVQKAIVAATLDALKPVLIEPNGDIVAPWTPIANDRFGPLQPDETLRAPYTRVDRRTALSQICTAITAWERLEKQEGAVLTESEKATLAALDGVTRALVWYAWGMGTLGEAAKAVDSAPGEQNRKQSLRLARLLLDERDVPRATARLLALERSAPKDEIHRAAVEELLRIFGAYERLRASLPMWNPGLAEAVQPYLKDAAWAPARERIVRELDKAFGSVDLNIVLADTELTGSVKNVLESKHDTPPTDPSSKDASDIVVPPDILAKAELGDHWETINPDRLDTQSAFGNPDAHMFYSDSEIKKQIEEINKDSTLTAQDKSRMIAELQKLQREKGKVSGAKPSRYRKLGYLAGVLRKNVLLNLDPKMVGQREVREEFELQVDHQEFLIEALGPNWQKDTSKGFRPLTPDAPLRILTLTRYHGELEIEARRLPDRAAYEKIDGGIRAAQIQALPIVKTFVIAQPLLFANLQTDPTKSIVEIKDHGLSAGFYVLTARARYCPVVAVTRVAVSDVKVVVRHAPQEVLIWTLERLSGTPLPATKLAGQLALEYVGATAWGDAPLPASLQEDGRSRQSAEFLRGFGDALNDCAAAVGDEAYLTGVSEGRKQKAKFPPQALKLPAATDAEGIARVPLPKEWLGHRCRIAVVANGCEVDAIAATQDVRRPQPERVVEWVADRPVVRPGQSARLRGFVRESLNGRMSVARGGEIPLTVTAGSAKLFEASVPVDEQGACVYEQAIDEDLSDAVLSVATGGTPKPLCQIRGGHAPSRRVRLELPQQPCAAGSRFKARATVESASGSPLAGIAVNVAISYFAYEWDQTAALPFGNDFARAVKPAAQSFPAWNSAYELTTDGNGLVEFEIELPEGRRSVGVVTARTAGGVRSAVQASGKILALTDSCVWSVERAQQPWPGKPANIAIAARQLGGQPYAKTFDINDEQGHLLGQITLDKEGRGAADFQPGANHRVRIRPSDPADGDWTYVTLKRGEEATEYRGRTIGARLDRKEYRIGDTARLTLRTDRPNVTVLMTTETSLMTRTQLIQVPARSKEVEIKVGEQDAPNCTIALTTLTDDLVDVVLMPLDVAQVERELTVKLETTAATLQPGQAAQLTAQVTDAHGQPVVDADVVLAVYDRQLLALADDPAPQFGAPFAAASRLSHDVGWVTGFYTFSYGTGYLWLAPEWSYGPYAADAERLGLGSGRGSFGNRNGGGRRLMVKRHGGSRATEGFRLAKDFRVRSEFTEQALWETRLKTGPNGQVSVPFVAPDNLTTYRVVAYALSDTGYPGSATLEIPVHRDIEVALSLPTELREGDRAEASLCVWNHSARKQTVKLAAKMPLPVVSSHLVAGAERRPIPDRIELEPHGNATVRYLLDVLPQVKAGTSADAPPSIDPGTFGEPLAFEVLAADGNDAVLDRAIFQAPLRYSGRPEREVTQSVLRNGERVHIDTASTYDPPRTSVTLTIRRGLRGLALDVRDLQYVFPEHCIEQTMSRFVPAVALADALGDATQTPAEKARLISILRSGIARLRSGGFSQEELHPLAAWYLQRLSQAPVGRSALKTGADWIAQAEYSEWGLRPDNAKDFKIEELSLPPECARTSPSFGAFRQDLWCAFGAAQRIHAARTPAEGREIRFKFARICQSALQLARTRKLAMHDRALAGLLCATLGRRTEAEELLSLTGGAAAASDPQQLKRDALWREHHIRTLACALDVLTAVALRKPETEVLPLALALQQRVAAKADGFGTTFLNGISLMALAEAIKASGGAAKVEAGPVTVKLGGKTVAELPAGTDMRRLRIKQADLEAAYKNGWDLEAQTPEGQSISLAIERRTLVPEKLEPLSHEAVEMRIAALAALPKDDERNPLIRRALFVRAPNQKDVALYEGWQPYAGQALPRGTELLVVTSVVAARGLQDLQYELPQLPNWEATNWNEQWELSTNDRLRPDVFVQRRQPGVVAAASVTAALNRDTTGGCGAAAEMLELVKTGRWTLTTRPLGLLPRAMDGAIFSDRGSRLVLTPLSVRYGRHQDDRKPAAPEKWATLVFAQSGALRGAGRYQLPGARVWGWYDPDVDVTGSADCVEVTDAADAMLEMPALPLNHRGWLEKSWQLLTREGWDAKTWEGAGETVDLRALTLFALGQCASDKASQLVVEALQMPAKLSSLEQFRSARAERLELINNAQLRNARADIRRSALTPFASWEALRREWVAAAPPVDQPPALKALTEWLQCEKQAAEELLVSLPADERPKAVAMQKQTVRDLLELCLKNRGDAQSAALAFLWSQPAQEIIGSYDGTLDRWVDDLREIYGLDIHVDPHAPLVLSLPVPAKGELLKDYVANRLAAAEIAAAGLERGQKIVLQQIGGEALAGKPLDAPSAMLLPVYSFGTDKSIVPALREALSCRGIRFIVPEPAELKVNKIMLRKAIDWISRLINRGARVEGNVIQFE